MTTRLRHWLARHGLGGPPPGSTLDVRFWETFATSYGLASERDEHLRPRLHGRPDGVPLWVEADPEHRHKELAAPMRVRADSGATALHALPALGVDRRGPRTGDPTFDDEVALDGPLSVTAGLDDETRAHLLALQRAGGRVRAGVVTLPVPLPLGHEDAARAAANLVFQAARALRPADLLRRTEVAAWDTLPTVRARARLALAEAGQPFPDGDDVPTALVRAAHRGDDDALLALLTTHASPDHVHLVADALPVARLASALAATAPRADARTAAAILSHTVHLPAPAALTVWPLLVPTSPPSEVAPSVARDLAGCLRAIPHPASAPVLDALVRLAAWPDESVVEAAATALFEHGTPRQLGPLRALIAASSTGRRRHLAVAVDAIAARAGGADAGRLVLADDGARGRLVVPTTRSGAGALTTPTDDDTA